MCYDSFREWHDKSCLQLAQCLNGIFKSKGAFLVVIRCQICVVLKQPGRAGVQRAWATWSEMHAATTVSGIARPLARVLGYLPYLRSTVPTYIITVQRWPDRFRHNRQEPGPFREAPSGLVRPNGNSQTPMRNRRHAICSNASLFRAPEIL